MRYSRQELVIGKKAQQKIEDSHIAIVGVGALGSVAAELLVRSGVKKLTLIDRDIVEVSNLQRQQYEEEDVDKPKVLILEKKLKKINNVEIITHFDDLNPENVDILKANVVIDGTDNLQTRFLINDFCLKNKIPWIYGSAIGTEGYVKVIMKSPCLQCFLQPASLDTCDTKGVLNTITNLVATLQVNETIRVLIEKPKEDLYYMNVYTLEFKPIKVKSKENCKACNGNYEYLDGKHENVVKLCGTNTYQFKHSNYDKVEGKDLGFGKKVDEHLILKDRALIHASSEKEAKSIFSKIIGD